MAIATIDETAGEPAGGPGYCGSSIMAIDEDNGLVDESNLCHRPCQGEGCCETGGGAGGMPGGPAGLNISGTSDVGTSVVGAPTTGGGPFGSAPGAAGNMASTGPSALGLPAGLGQSSAVNAQLQQALAAPEITAGSSGCALVLGPCQIGAANGNLLVEVQLPSAGSIAPRPMFY